MDAVGTKIKLKRKLSKGLPRGLQGVIKKAERKHGVNIYTVDFESGATGEIAGGDYEVYKTF